MWAKGKVFQSFFGGGFECSTHRLRSGKRLDQIAATNHDKLAFADYIRLRNCGIGIAREGLRWHLIEKLPGHYDFSSALPMIAAARETGTQVIWDICHYGWPDWLDVFSPEFIDRFAALARAFAALLKSETDSSPLITPINEISFLAWAGGAVGYMHPFEKEQSPKLKMQLVRAAIAGIEAIWTLSPQARFIHVDPVINVVHNLQYPRDRYVAEKFRVLQYEAWDMLAGYSQPQLGGAEKYLDIIGVNYYPANQWVHGSKYRPSRVLKRSDSQYRPFRNILSEVYERYNRPIFVAETGAEDDERQPWLHYVCAEIRAAMRTGVPIEGLCLYPIVNFPGWDDNRHCHNGLWDYADETGEREIFEPLSRELDYQMKIMEKSNLGNCWTLASTYSLESSQINSGAEIL